MDEKTIARFWPKVERRGPSECWPWLGAQDRKGYGRFYAGNPTKKPMLAHRASLVISGVDLTSADYALHSCDNPNCCNPCHLYRGDHAQNMRDMQNRGRRKGIVAVRGDAVRNGQPVRFTEADIVVIRLEAATGPWGIQSTLAKRYGVSVAQINDIVRRRRWKHVA